MRYATTLFAIVLATSQAGAQGVSIAAQEAESARRLLDSQQWVEKAWGIYLAGRLLSTDLEKPLVEQFRSAADLRESSYGSEEYAFLAVLFDAAIQAGIKVPTDLLAPFVEKWSAPVLILLARDEHSEDLLLSLRGEESRDAVWLAANNLLFQRKSQRWYRAMLAEINITHRFVMTDGSENPGFGSGRGSLACADGFAAMPKDFPPVTLYGLKDHGFAGSVLLVDGPQRVFYEKTVVPTNRQVGTGSCRAKLDRMAVRIGYLATFQLDSKADIERLIHAETYIEHTADFERQVEGKLQDQEAGIRTLLQAGESRGFTASGTRLRIVPQVVDKRQKAAGALPILAPREIDLY